MAQGILVRDIHQRDTLANRPTASSVSIGTLFFDTTNSILYRSNGTTWDSVEGTGGQASLQFKDEGSNLGTSGTVTSIDFVGSGVTATRSVDAITVNVSAGGSGLTQEEVLNRLAFRA